MKHSLLSALAFFMTTAPVMAATDASAKGGLPQLDPASFSSQIFWMFVFFILLYLLMATVALPRIGTVLETRALKINNDVDDARSLRNEAEAIKLAYERNLAETQQKIRDMMSDNQALISKRSADENQALTERLNKHVQDAEARIAGARQKAMDSIQDASAVIALEIANKFASVAVNDNDAATAVKNLSKKKG